MQSTVLGSYKAELREFRALQEELEPWTEAFKEQHKRKPTLADVQATRETASTDLLLPQIANSISRAAQCLTHRPFETGSRMVCSDMFLSSHPQRQLGYLAESSSASTQSERDKAPAHVGDFPGCTQHADQTIHCCIALQAYHGS